MGMNSIINEAKKRATSTIKTIWEKIAANYTVGWMGPIEIIEKHFPFISSEISDIKTKISPNLPIVIYQTCESPPKKMVVIVPYRKNGDNPYNCRFISSHKLATEHIQMLSEFSQAFWFLIDNKVLPRPEDGRKLEKTLVQWTGIKLISHS